MIRPVLLFVLCLLKIELREVFCGCSKHSMACFEWQECWKIMYRKNEHVVLLWYEVRHCVSMSGTKSWSSDFGGVWDPQILKCCHFWHYIPLKSLVNFGQNEVWARPVPSKLSERRPPTLFLGADNENGQTRFWRRWIYITCKETLDHDGVIL